MSEYQYFEFQAVDRPLNRREIMQLRRYSTRATITSTRFVNHYEWGDFNGDLKGWMRKYFDAFLYVANWGTHRLMLRLRRDGLKPSTAKTYCCSRSASARAVGEFTILDFCADDEPGDDWDDDGSGWLSALIPVRAELIGGDYRALYLAWLRSVQDGALKRERIGPPVPPGLGKLTAAQKAFADFLRIDAALIERASRYSIISGNRVRRDEAKHWIATLTDAQKTQWLTRAIFGDARSEGAELMRSFQQSRRHPAASVTRLRPADLLASADARGE